jgi:hypothetical protein
VRSIRLPPFFDKRRRGSCVPAVVTLLSQLEQGRDFIYEGYVVLDTGKHDEHTWMEIEGILFDPTAAQYRKRQREYIVVKRFTVSAYREQWRRARSHWWDERVRSFGGVPC